MSTYIDLIYTRSKNRGLYKVKEVPEKKCVQFIFISAKLLWITNPSFTRAVQFPAVFLILKICFGQRTNSTNKQLPCSTKILRVLIFADVAD